MCRVAGLMAAMGGTAAMWCSFATQADAIWGRCGGASTFELGVGKVAKGPTGMGLGARSF